MIVELTEAITENLEHFTGRVWLLPLLLKWYEQADDRICIITGEPGSGKSMILSWLAGGGPAPPEATGAAQLEQLRSRVKAAHFCIAASGSIAPKAFAKRVAEQLTQTVAGFGEALASTLNDLVKITAEPHIGTMTGGTVIPVSIGQLNLSALGDESSFDRALREPLKQLYANGYSEPMLLLIDAMDEAATYTGEITIVKLLAKLADLPGQIRLLITTRSDPRVLKYFRQATTFDLIKDAPGEVDDVHLYLSKQLAVLSDEEQRVALSDRISQAAQGNFLYAHLVLSDLLPGLPATFDPATLHLPEGLTGLYHDFLTRELGDDEDRWYSTFKPLLGLIAVAQGEGLSRIQIARISGKDIEQALRICKQYLRGDLPDGPFRPFHRSFADFLEDEKNSDYRIDAVNMHRQIVEYYLRNYEGQWSQCDAYGLQYLPQHLFSIKENQQLVNLLKGPFLIAKVQYLGSYRSILDDLRLGMQAAERLPNLPVLLYFALLYVGLKQRVSNLPVQDLIPLYAAVGQVDRAVELAKMVDTDWKRLSTMRAIVDTLKYRNRDKALQVAKQIEDPGYLAEAFTAILEAMLPEEQSLNALASLLDQILKLIEQNKNPYWQSWILWHLAEMLYPINKEQATSLVGRAIEFARIIQEAQWRYENLRILAQTASRRDKAQGRQLYQEAIVAIEQMEESDWKAEKIGETFGELAALDEELAITLATKLRSVVGKPFVLAHLAAYFSRRDQQRAISLVKQALAAARDITLKFQKTEAYDWKDHAEATTAWAMARYDLEAAEALLNRINSRYVDAAYSRIVYDLAGDIQLALSIASRIEKLYTRSDVLAHLASSVLEHNVDSSLSIIEQIPLAEERCRAMIDIGARLLVRGDTRGVSAVNHAIERASSQDDMGAVLLAELATKLGPLDQNRSEELRQRAVEIALTGGNTDQSIKVLIQVANLYIQEDKTTSALTLMQKVAHYSRSDIYDQAWLIDSLSVLTKELVRSDLPATITLIEALPQPAQAFVLSSVIEPVAGIDLDEALKLADLFPDRTTKVYVKSQGFALSRDLADTRLSSLASILLVAANHGSHRMIELAEELWQFGNDDQSTIVVDSDLKIKTLAKAIGAIARHHVDIAQRLLNKFIAEPYECMQRLYRKDEMQPVADMLKAIAQSDREVAMNLIPEVTSAYMAQRDWDAEIFSVLCEGIASFAPDPGMALLKGVTVDPGYRSKVLSSAAQAVAKYDQVQALSILDTAIQEANRSQWKWLTIEALLVAASRTIEWARPKMQSLVDQALVLAREAQKKLSIGDTLAKVARLFLLTDQVNQAILFLSEAIESMRFYQPSFTRREILQVITEALDLCPKESLIQFLPQFLYVTLETEDFIFEGIPLILPYFLQASTTDVSETIRSLVQEIEMAANMMQEIFIG